MRLLIDQGGYLFANLGDWAMLQVTIRRIRKLFPQAQLRVMTRTAELLVRSGENAAPLTTKARAKAIGREAALPLVGRVLPELEWQVQRRFPGLAGRLAQTWSLVSAEQRRGVREYLECLRECDAVITSGGGFLADEFPRPAEAICREFCLAQDMGKTTAMFGIGLGPIETPELKRWCSRALPRLSYISVREDIASPGILKRLGMPAEKMCVTGDDAIEVAYEMRGESLGTGVGVNLRLNQHSQLSVSALGRLRDRIIEFAQAKRAELVPCPIAFFPKYNDAQALVDTFGSGHGIGDGGMSIHTPQDVLGQTNRCRIMITGSYHPAVFALSQGIPTILLGRSPYYLLKHRGLVAQFGEGSRIIAMDEDGWERKLAEAMAELWAQAEGLRPGLLDQARRQIALSEQAYSRFGEILAHRQQSARPI